MCVSPRYHESTGMRDLRQKHIAQMGLQQTHPLSRALGTRNPTTQGRKSLVPLGLRGESAPGILLGFPAMMTELSIPWLDPHWTALNFCSVISPLCLGLLAYPNIYQSFWQTLTLRSSSVWLLFEDSTSGRRSCSDQTSVYEFGSHTKGSWRHMMDMVKTLTMSYCH